ncbi:hypothetical protein RG47T_3586 [Mucilaginibacter polytrichastri]|uniref:histidine kinase n=2 Tax=Mucilaginibacter polytrichastri TaxID=1302689 RepID=A0A1Q6A2C4_9SPHI|nr:hypothetical protein RG47T_3586 [Mucilaginibacter polytrichastri]
MFIQAMLDKVKPDEGSFEHDALQRVNRQVNKMTTLIQNLLNNTKLLDGTMELHCERFNLHQLIEEVVFEAKLTLPGYFYILKDCSTAYVYADRLKISQVLDNLISNAAKYSPKGSEITIKCKVEQEKVHLSITDNGIGIAKNEQERLFDRYYRVNNDKIRNISGFGIGLYVVAEILHSHNSKIYLESEENVGSTFFFELPDAL